MASKDSADRSINMEQLGAAAKFLQAMAKPVIEALTVAVPVIIKFINKAYVEYSKLPQNVIHFVIGFIYCFFGGTFPTLFAAIQAAEHSGRATVVQAVTDLSQEAMYIIEESKKDDDVNNNNTDSREYATRKMKLVLRKANPEKLDKAIASIYKVWLSVVAVLSLEFARTISMALAIADFLKKPAFSYLTPIVQAAVPSEYDKWVPVVIGWMIKAFAMSIAWYIQSVVSAFASALKGGLIMSRAFYEFCIYHNFDLGGMLPADHTKTHFDEIISYVFAALGFYSQFRSNFKVPFPFSILFYPVQALEYYIRWSVTSRGQVPVK